MSSKAPSRIPRVQAREDRVPDRSLPLDLIRARSSVPGLTPVRNSRPGRARGRIPDLTRDRMAAEPVRGRIQAEAARGIGSRERMAPRS